MRIRVSNALGATAVEIAGASVALREPAATIVAETHCVLTFGGENSVVLRPGEDALSDSVAMNLRAGDDLAVSFYFANSMALSSLHVISQQTGYISSAGDFTAETDFPTSQMSGSWFILAAIEARANGNATCLGDLPEGANNRDGHALRLIGRDLQNRCPARGRRIVLHACDGSPSAAGYGGQPALGATRDALVWFRTHVAPIGQIGLEFEQNLAPFGAPFIDWDESRATIDLRRLVQQLS